jgi:DNA-binding NarL/FixJ family response regulator
MPGSPESLLVADHDSIARGEIVDALRTAGFAVCEADNGGDALALARSMPPAAAVLDPMLPGLSGYEVCRRLKDDRGDGVAVVFVSGERTESCDRVAGLLVGADDYLVKPVAADELVTRVRALIARANRSASSDDTRGALDEFTAREREILQQLGRGLGQDQIAAQLFISPKTVANHMDHILKKLGVHSRAQAVAAAYQRGLLEPQVLT